MRQINHALLVPSLRGEFTTSMDSFFDDIFDKAFPNLSDSFGVAFERGSYPKVDIIDEPTKIVIEAEIPGLKKEDVSIDVKENILTIQGRKNVTESTQDINKTYIKRELKRSSFARSFIIGDNIDINSADAKFDNGMLTVNLTKKKPEEPRVRKVEIK